MVVYVTYNIHEAQIVAGRLQSEGIMAYVHQEPGASAMGIHIGTLGEIKVLVYPQDYALAESILFPDEPDTLSSDTDQIIFGDDDDAE
jgi:hypothetical protein